MHERNLVGKVYDHYCFNELALYSRGVEDLLSFLSLPIQRRVLRGDADEDCAGQYPDWGSGFNPCIFSHGVASSINVEEDLGEEGEEEEGEEERAPKKTVRMRMVVQIPEEDMLKAELLATILLRQSSTEQGVLIWDATIAQWKEDPKIVETLSDWTIMSIKASPPKAVKVFKPAASALVFNFQSQSRPHQVQTEQSITLSPVATSIVKLTFRGLLDLVQTLLSILPKRQKVGTRFKTTKAQNQELLKREATERARKRTLLHTELCAPHPTSDCVLLSRWFRRQGRPEPLSAACRAGHPASREGHRDRPPERAAL